MNQDYADETCNLKQRKQEDTYYFNKQDQKLKINTKNIKKESYYTLLINWIQDENSFATCYFIVAVVAFSQGILNLSDISINFMYKDDFHLSPAQLGLIQGIVQLPWIFKPVFGMISDCIPFFGYRRKSYLILFGFSSFWCWNCLAFEVRTNIYLGIGCILVNQICVAFCNVIGEALLVEISQKKAKLKKLSDTEQQTEASKNVSLFFGIKSFGTLITAYLGGYLLQVLDKHVIFQITSYFPLFLCFSAYYLQEESSEERKSNLNKSREHQNQQQIQDEDFEDDDDVGLDQLGKFFKFIKMPYIYRPILFIFLFMITPNSSSTMFFFYTNKLGFEPEFLGELKLVYAVASISGMIIYNKYLKFVEFKKQFVITSIGCCVLGLSQILLVTRKNIDLGIPDKLFCLGDSVIIQVIGELNTLPLLVLACRICPKNIEGTMYAVIMSTLNFGNLIASQLGGLVAYLLNITENNFDNLWIQILIANITTVMPLLFIGLVEMDKVKETKKSYHNISQNLDKSYKNDQNQNQTYQDDILNESIDEISALVNVERMTI